MVNIVYAAYALVPFEVKKLDWFLWEHFLAMNVTHKIMEDFYRNEPVEYW